MPIIDRPEEGQGDQEQEGQGAEPLVKGILGAQSQAAELAVEYLGPPLSTAAWVADYLPNLGRGAAAGKLDEAFTRTVFANEIPGLIPHEDDSPDVSVLKKMAGHGIDVIKLL